MQLSPTAIATHMLTHVPSTKRFICEASDLGNRQPSRVWDDACDEGYTIISSRTGNQSVWAHHDNKRDAGGDLQVSIFTPTPETVRKFPLLKGYKLEILND